MSRTRFFVLLAALAALATGGGGAAAQTPGPAAPANDRLVALFSGMSAQREVQVVTPTLFIEQASFQSVRGSVVELSRQGETIAVPIDEIRAVSEKRSHALEGALWGVGAGILVGSVSGMMIGSFGCKTEGGCSATEKEGALRWGIAVGLAGAVTGFLFGRRAIYWQPIFP